MAALARSRGEEPASPRHGAGVASMAWRSTRLFRTNAPYDLISTQAVARRDERGDDRTTARTAHRVDFATQRHVQRFLDSEQRASQRRKATKTLRERQAEGALAEPFAQRYWCVGGHRCSSDPCADRARPSATNAACCAREAQCCVQPSVQPVCSRFAAAGEPQLCSKFSRWTTVPSGADNNWLLATPPLFEPRTNRR